MQSQSPDPNRFTTIQLKQSIQKGTTLFLVQSTTVGNDIGDTMASPYATMLEEFIDMHLSHYRVDYLQNKKWPILFPLSRMGNHPLG